MDLLANICTDHHSNFFDLLGLQQPKELQYRKSKRIKQSKQVRYKLPTKRPVKKLPKPQYQKPLLEKQVDSECITEETKLEKNGNVNSNVETEAVAQEVTNHDDITNTTTVSKNVAAARIQKNFFHIVMSQTSANLKRFLRTNAAQININETLDDKKVEKKGGPFCGWSAVHIAAFRGMVDMIEILLTHGADVNISASLQSETPLAVATWKQHTNVVRFLLENGADVHSRNTNRGGQQPIHISCINGNLEIIQLLIAHGADIYSKTSSKGAQSPVELAARMGKLDLLRYMEAQVDTGDLLPFSFLSANPETIQFAIRKTNLKEDQYLSILDDAVALISKSAYQPQLKEIIVSIGTKFNWLSGPNIFLFRIIQHRLAEAFSEIIRYWAKVSKTRIQYFQYSNQTLLYYACACDVYDIVEFLLEEIGVTPNSQSNGETPLILCAKEGKENLCSLLIRNNADIFSKTSHSGEIALHAAARFDKPSICSLLLESNAKKQLEHFSISGMNPLHVSASKLSRDAVKILLENGADVNAACPKTNHTALHYACTMNSDSNPKKRIAVIDLLLDNGADITMKCSTAFGELGVVELACVSPFVVGHLIARGAPEVSIEEINRKREEARKKLGQILIFEDVMTDMEDKVIHNPQQFAMEMSTKVNEIQTQTLQTKQSFQPSTKQWKSVRLFLSSTFVDMQSERELLVKRIIPRVKELCAKRKIHLVDIDLRWGVTEEDVQNGKALEVCLREAQKADIFCGLLGSRYGWVPSEIPDNIKDAYQWKEGYSITHMEIQEGVMRRFGPHSKELENCRAFFCMRNDSATQKISPKYRDQFIESDIVKIQALNQLKQDISSRNIPQFSYEARLDYGTGFPQFSELEKFGQEFESHLIRAIDSLHPISEYEEIKDDLVIERQFHQTFIEMRSASFLGRGSMIDSISKEITSAFDTPNIIVVSGEAGSGKSSLMAKMVSKFYQSYSVHELFILPHFIGGSPSSVSIRNTLFRICEEINREFEFSQTVENDFDELVVQFHSLLNRVSTNGHKRLVLFIDALNQLDASNQSHNLAWLPTQIPSNVSIVVSALPSDCLQILQERRNTVHIAVPQLTASDRNEIISETLGRYQKKLTTGQREALLSKKGTTNPLFLTMACEELRIFGNFEQLEQKIRSIASDVPSLLDQVLARLEGEYGKELVRTTLGLLEISRFGLLEEELLEMNPSLSRFQWSEFFLSIKFYLRPVGGSSNEKILDFFHRQFAKAVRHRYLDTNIEQSLHQTLALYFLTKIAPEGIRSFSASSEYSRGYSEVVYHLFYAKNQNSNIESLLTSLPFIEKKCLLGFTYDLIRDYILVASSSLESLKKAIQPFQEFCMGNTHFMDEFPYTILQMAMNQAESSPVYSAAVQLHKQIVRKRKNEVHTPLVCWMNKPLVEKNQQEFRRFNIGARANCSRGTRNGQLLAVGDISGRVKLYNARIGEELAVLLQSSERVTALDFSADDKYLVVASSRYTFLFDVATKTLLHQISLHQNNAEIEILCVAFSPDVSSNGIYSFIAGSSDGVVTMTQLDPTVNHSSQSTIVTKHSKEVNCCCFVPNGRGIISGGGNKQLTWVNEKEITVFSGHTKAVKACAVSSHGKWMVSCSQDRSLIMYDLTAQTQIVRLEGHADMVESCHITPDDRYIISGSWDKRVYLWDVEKILESRYKAPTDTQNETQITFAVLGEHAHFLNDVHAFGNNAVVSSSADMTVKLFRIPNESLEVFKSATEGPQDHHTELVCGMDFDPVHQWIATASWDKHVKLLRMQDATQVADFSNHTKRVNDVTFSNSYEFVVSASMDHTVNLWNLETFENTKTFVGHSAAVMAVDVSHDDKYIASGAADKSIKFWDVATGNCIDTITAHTSWVDTLKFSQCSRMLASASVDGETKVWNTSNGVLLAHLKKHSAPVLDVQWTSGDKYLITVGEDWLIRVWQTGTWDCVRVISGHKHEVTASCVLDEMSEMCSMFQCKNLLATASADQTIRFWNYITGEQLWIYCGSNAYSYLIYIGKSTFVAGDSRGGVHLLSLST